MPEYLEIKNVPPRNTALVDTDWILVMDVVGTVQWIPATLVAEYMQGLGGGSKVTITAAGNPAIPYGLTSGDLMDYIVVIPSANGNFSIGTTPGGEQILFSTPITEDVHQVFNLGYYADGGIAIYLNGLPSGSVIKIYKK